MIFAGKASVVGIGINRVAGGFGVKVNLSEPAPPDADLPETIDGVPVHVEVVGALRSADRSPDAAARSLRFLPPGESQSRRVRPLPFPRPERPQDAAERPEQPFPSRSCDGATRIPPSPSASAVRSVPSPGRAGTPGRLPPAPHRTAPGRNPGSGKVRRECGCPLSISMADGLIDQDADRDEPGPIVVGTQLAGELAQMKEGGRLAGAAADGLLISSDRANFSLAAG